MEAVSQNTLWFSPAAAKAVSKDTELTQGRAAEELRQDSAWGFPLVFHGQLSLLKSWSQRQLEITLIMIYPDIYNDKCRFSCGLFCPQPYLAFWAS